jgi:hypothetical protein
MASHPTASQTMNDISTSLRRVERRRMQHPLPNGIRLAGSSESAPFVGPFRTPDH